MMVIQLEREQRAVTDPGHSRETGPQWALTPHAALR
jgi:hypothetical protein